MKFRNETSSPTPVRMYMTVNNVPASVCGAKSPRPTVAKVVTEKYNASIHRPSLDQAVEDGAGDQLTRYESRQAAALRVVRAHDQAIETYASSAVTQP
jgi:hypothetical protein